VRPGMPAVIGGPHGRFNHAKGTGDQIWIAGGVGITPFLSWLRDLDQKPIMRRVDFFYTHSGSDAPFRSEIEAIAAGHPTVHAHVLDTSTDGRLTVDQVLAVTSASPRELSVFLCGPEGMVRTLQTGLRRAGVPDQQIHREYFDWR
jgi:predicted ferric reductase